MIEHVAYPLTHQLSSLSAELRVHNLRERVRTAAPLRAAAERGDLVRVQQGLRQVDTSSEAAKVALQVAVAAGQPAVVRHLLTAGVPIENSARDATQSGSSSAETSPLVIQAALADSPDTLRVLEEFGQSLLQVGHVSVLERGRGSRASLVTAPMGAAAWALKLSALQELVSFPDLETEVKAEVRPLSGAGGSNARNQDFAWASGATPLILAVQAAGRGAVSNADEAAARAVQLLLNHSANPEARSAGESALHVAARCGLKQVVQALLDKKADPEARNAQGDTPHALAVRTGRNDCAELLAQADKPEESDLAAELLDEEEAELAKLQRAREKRREKKSRQREKRAASPAADPKAEKEKPEKAAAPEKPEKPELTGEALQKRVAELRREKTRAAQKVKHLSRRVDEESAKAEVNCAQLAELRQRRESLRAMSSQKQSAVQKAEESESAARRRAEVLTKRRSEIQEEASQEAEKVLQEAAALRALLEALQKKRTEGSSCFAAVRQKRLAAEHRRKELQLELMAIARSLQAPEGLQPVPPLFTATGPPDVRNAPLFRELYKQQQMHLAAMRELIVATNQQIAEREAELEQEMDVVIGSGLPKLLQALRAEGVISSCPEPPADAGRAARLQMALLKS